MVGVAVVAFACDGVQVVVVVVVEGVAFALDFLEWVGVAIGASDWLVEGGVAEWGLGSRFGENWSFFFESSRGA